MQTIAQAERAIGVYCFYTYGRAASLKIIFKGTMY